MRHCSNPDTLAHLRTLVYRLRTLVYRLQPERSGEEIAEGYTPAPRRLKPVHQRPSG